MAPFGIDMEGVSSPTERVEWLTENYDISVNCAKALLLAEMGFSHSGIASKLNVTEGTARGYIRTLESTIGEGVTETLPKDVRYPTFPGDTPKDDVPSTKDVLDEKTFNRGASLSQIAENLSDM
jgi:hypothetical protein